jgi:hypothetical protein
MFIYIFFYVGTMGDLDASASVYVDKHEKDYRSASYTPKKGMYICIDLYVFIHICIDLYVYTHSNLYTSIYVYS